MSVILEKCKLCGAYISETKEGRAAHLKQAHGVTASPLTLTVAAKAVIVDRAEDRLGRRHFITPDPLPIPPTHAHKCNVCGPTNDEGYWLTDGTGICEPCVKESVARENAEAAETEIQYHD